jgi:ADP-heptose:LPS heptosyltransferase
MPARTLICFPGGDAPGLRADAAQLALGLAARGGEVIALGPLGPWRHVLRLAKITAVEFALPGEERKLTHAVQEYEPQVIHAFGADAAHLVLPLTMLVGAGGVATLGHADLTRINPAHFRTASTIFVPCTHLQEQVSRRLPSLPVVPTGYLLPPASDVPTGRNRFLAEELGIDDDAPVVLMADHFRGGETQVALALIEAAPLIAERVPEVQIVIAGRGLRLSELESRALETNDRLGRRAVLLPGHRDDLAQVLPFATVAVGTGRFAMEAIGAGVATIAAGAAGMVGTYTPDTDQVTRFSCAGTHGHLDAVQPRLLAAEVVGLFSYADYRQHFAREGQTALLAESERTRRAEQIATYYTRTAPSGAISRTPQRLTCILPGDLRELLFTLPAVYGLHAQFPLAHFRYLVPAAHTRLLQACGWADVHARPEQPRDWPGALLALWRERADVSLAFGSDFLSGFLAGCTLASHRLGFTESGANLFLSDHLHPREPVSPARAHTLTQPLGAGAGTPVAPTLPAEAREAVNLTLLSAGVEAHEPLILLCPGAEDGRTWDGTTWITLLKELLAARPERVAVLEPGALALPDDVVPVAAGGDSLLLAALLARADLVIAPDNGPLHLADLLGTPAIGLFGPTAPALCRLPGSAMTVLCRGDRPCHPCTDPCAENACLRGLTPTDVLAAVDAALPVTIVRV